VGDFLAVSQLHGCEQPGGGGGGGGALCCGTVPGFIFFWVGGGVMCCLGCLGLGGGIKVSRAKS